MLTSSEEETMPYFGYMAYYADPTQSEAQRRAADAQLGQSVAALARLCRSLATPVHALRHRSSPSQPARAACVSAGR
jgi:hypothetical protein